MKTILILLMALICGACIKSNGRFGGTMPDGTASRQSAAQPQYYPEPLPMPQPMPESVPGRNLPVFATEDGGGAVSRDQFRQWEGARAADPNYHDAVRTMQGWRNAYASRGMMTSFDHGHCTLAQSAEKCREARTRLDQNAEQWLRDSGAAKERGEP